MLDELRNFLLGLLLIDGAVDLLLHIVLHVLVHLADHPGNVTLCHLLLCFRFKFIIFPDSFS